MLSQNVEELDRSLDELEALARSDLPSAAFLTQLLQRLRSSLEADACGLAVPFGDSSWQVIAQDCAPLGGNPPASNSPEWANQLNAELPPRTRDHQSWSEDYICLAEQPRQFTLCYPLRAKDFNRGCLCLTWSSRPDESTLRSTHELLKAYAEVATTRQAIELEKFLETQADNLRQLLVTLGRSTSLDDAAVRLVNWLPQVLSVDRVSLCRVPVHHRKQAKRTSVVAISGAGNISQKSAAVEQLADFAGQVVASERTVLESSTDEATGVSELGGAAEEQSLAHRIGLLLGDPNPSQEVLVLEFESHQNLITGCSRLPHVWPLLETAWQPNRRFWSLPKPIRHLAIAKRPGFSSFAGWCKLASLLFAIALLIWALFRPYSLVVEAAGIHAPVIKRIVFASNDGFIEELFVGDGEQVSAGQTLLRIRSPDLELKLEEARGSIRAIEKDLMSTRVALNQLTPNKKDFVVEQNRLAARISELELRRENIESRQKILQEQRSKLLVVAPIEGSVNAKDIEQQLQGRPVNRGDPLFQVVDLDGPWEIRVRVADRDSQYVRHRFFESDNSLAKGTFTALPASEDPPVENQASESQLAAEDEALRLSFVFDNQPQIRHLASTTWISDHVENAQEFGCFVEVRAKSDLTEGASPNAGAGVHAYFDCGKQPAWFVWCRPVVEFLQRGFWLP